MNREIHKLELDPEHEHQLEIELLQEFQLYLEL